MMYLLKKILLQFFMPLPFSLALCVAGLALLWFTRRQKAGKLLTTVGVVLLTLSSYGFVSDLLIGRLERQNSPLILSTQADLKTQPPIKWIVVLGGGNLSDTRRPGKSYLTAASLFRVVEGIRIYRESPGARLIVSGGPTNNAIPEAETMAQVAESLGVPKQDVVLDPVSKDTEAQAHRIQEMVNGEQFILVSSAYHLPRALSLFRSLGLNPLAAPVDYRTGNQGPGPDAFFPGALNVRKSELAIHEDLGLIWYRLRGRN